MKVCYILAILLLIFSMGFISATSLELTSGTTTLGGNLTYESIIIHTGATLSVNSTIGYLNLTATNYIYVYGTIDGSGKGSSTGVGIGGDADWFEHTYDPYEERRAGGGGGAGHSTFGGIGGEADADHASAGSGVDGGSKGTFYGSNISYNIELGSGGGDGGASYDGPYDGPGIGGIGGAGIVLNAPIIKINGTVNANATSGTNGDQGTLGENHVAGGGGGGSGGKIILLARELNITNGKIFTSGGNGGNGDVDPGYYGYELCGAGGGGGSGGMIILGYAQTFENTSSIVLSNGGTGGTASSDNTPNPCTNGAGGSKGNINYSLDSSLNFNKQPEITNYTINPTPDLNVNHTYFSINITDDDNDSVNAVYFTLVMPNSTIVINNVNSTWISGDTVLSETEVWETPRFNISSLDSVRGKWNWTILVVSNGSNQNTTLTGYFLIDELIPPSINIHSPTINQIWYRNVSIPLNYLVTDNVQLDSCWYTLDDGTTNVSIASCLNTTFSANAGNYNLTLYVNDTSGNLNSSKVNFTLNQDTAFPLISIISPSGILSSRIISVKVNGTDTGEINFCTINVTIGASLDTDYTNLTYNSLTGYYETTITVASDSSFVLNAYCVDYMGNLNKTNSSFSVQQILSGGGGGGGSILQPDELTFGKEESICAQFKTTFAEAVKTSRTQDRILDKLKTIWISLWDYLLCSSTASIYPI